MTNTTWLIIIIIVILIFIILASSSNKKSTHSSSFSSVLSSSKEVPPNVSSGTGISRANFIDSKTIRYTLRVENLTGSPTAAHFHLGASGQNGPILKTIELKASPSPNGVQVWVGEGIWSERDDEPLNQTIRNQLNNGNVYVNVHTEQYPDGEIRGQLVKA